MNAMSEIDAPTTLDPQTIRVGAGALRRAVAQAGMVVHRRTTIPILACLLLRPADRRLEIIGTDLDTCLTVECPAECGKKARAFIVSAPLLKSLLAGAEHDDVIEITRGKDKDVLTFKIGPAVAMVRDLHSIEDFPVMTDPDAEPSDLLVEYDDLADLIGYCAPCVSTEETRYYLNGIYFHARDGKLAGVATDGHKLSLYQTDTAWPLLDLIVPRAAIGVLAQLLRPTGEEGDLTITGWAGATRLRIAGMGWTMALKTIDGTFPDYPRVIPKRSDDAGYAVLSPATLRRVPRTTGTVAAKLDLERATLSVADICGGVEFSMPIEAGGNFAIGFNRKYLRAFTHAFGTVRIEATSSGDAATVLSDDPRWLGVLMPMWV